MKRRNFLGALAGCTLIPLASTAKSPADTLDGYEWTPVRTARYIHDKVHIYTDYYESPDGKQELIISRQYGGQTNTLVRVFSRGSCSHWSRQYSDIRHIFTSDIPYLDDSKHSPITRSQA